MLHPAKSLAAASTLAVFAFLLAFPTRHKDDPHVDPPRPAADYRRASLGKCGADEWAVPAFPRQDTDIDTGATPLPLPLLGQVALVTGSSSGIGKELALNLFRRGAHVIVTSRRLARAVEAVEWIKTSTGTTEGGTLEAAALDLSDLGNVRAFAERVVQRHGQLDMLSENAGMLLTDGDDGSYSGPWRTADGYEVTYASNYLGHFLLLNLLLPALLRSPDPRVSVTSSIMHWHHDHHGLEGLLPSSHHGEHATLENASFFARLRQYGNTKLLQIAMCFEAQRRLAAKGMPITIVPVAPGFINTGIGAHHTRGVHAQGVGLGPMSAITRPPSYGVMTSLHVLLGEQRCVNPRSTAGFFLQPYYSPLHMGAPPLTGLSVALFEFVLQKWNWGLHYWAPHRSARNATFAKQLWDASAVACGIAVKDQL